MHQLGTATTTTVNILYRATGNNSCYCTVGSKTSSPVTADTTVRDGVVRLDVSGLTAGTTYTYTIFESGAEVASGLCDTMPEAGTPFSIAYVGCIKNVQDSCDWIYEAIASHSPPVRLVCFQGDTPYNDEPSPGSGDTSAWGIDRQGFQWECVDRIAAVAAGVAADYDYTDAGEIANYLLPNYWAGLRQFRSTPGIKKIIERYSTMWSGDDHERPGDDFSGAGSTAGDLAEINSTATVVGNVSQIADLEAVCREGMQAWMAGNPANSDANNDPAFADADQSYFRLQVNGDVELFQVDNIHYKTSVDDAASARKIIGDTQRAWLTAVVTASTATSKIVITSSTLTGGNWRTAAMETGPHPQTADGSDTGERDTVVKALDEVTVQAWLSSDVHHASVSYHNGIPSLCPCPPVSSSSVLGSGYTDGRVWLAGGAANRDDTQRWNGWLGFCDVHSDGLDHKFYNRFYGREISMGRQYVGANTLTFPTGTLGVA